MEIIAGLALALGVLNSVLLVLVVREIGILKITGSRKSGLRFNTRLPEFTATTLTGSTLDSDQVRDQILLFVSPECGKCHEIASALKRVPRGEIPPLVVGVSTHGDSNLNEIREVYAFVPPDHIFVDARRQIFGELEVPGTPYAYVVSPSGRIRGSGVVGSVADLKHLASALG